MKRKPRPKVNLYNIIARAVEEGVAHGYTRTYKHTTLPSEEEMKEHMEREVLNALCEVLQL